MVERVEGSAAGRLEMIGPPQGFTEEVFGDFHGAGQRLAMGEAGGDGGGQRATRAVRPRDRNSRGGEAMDCAVMPALLE